MQTLVLKKIANMHIKNFILLATVMLFLFKPVYLNVCFADNLPVIINRSHEVHEIDGKKYHLHAVLKGQTLYSISRAYGVTVDDIIEENPHLEYGLKYDQQIKIPYVKDDEKLDKKDYIEHKVKRRETLFGISGKYGVDVEFILKHNPEARKGLKKGQVLIIPVEVDEEEPKHKKYQVSEGDTFFSISRKYNVSVDAIMEMNPGHDGVLKEGETIKLPYYAHFEPEDIIIDEYYTEPEYKKYEIELWDEDYCQDPVLKDQYNVALLIPFFLEDIEDYYTEKRDLETEEKTEKETEIKLPENHKSFTFIEFYEGLLIALDSLEEIGAEITLHVFDVCRDTSKALKVINKPEFDEMDLIIGSFFPESLEIIAEHACKHDISIVSPFLRDRRQLEYSSNIFQFTPSLKTQLNDLAGYISYKYPTQNIILVHNDQPQVTHIVSEFNNELNRKISKTQFIHDSLNLAKINGYYFEHTLIGGRATNVPVFDDSLLHRFTPPASRGSKYQSEEVLQHYVQRQNVEEVVLYRDSIEGLKNLLSINKTNVLVSLVGGEPVISNYLRELNLLSDTFDITVFGVPQWKNYKSLEIDHLHTANVHIITDDFVDYSNENVQQFVLSYRDRFNDEPGSYAFKGFETGYYFVNALMTYGKDFSKCIYSLNNQGDYNSARFIKTAGKNNGWENKTSTIFKYGDYRKIDVRKPRAADN